jgi:hypothetical protein
VPSVAVPTFAILCRGEVSEWLMVPLSKSGVRKHRGFESRPLRQDSSHRPVGVMPIGLSLSGERSPSGLWRRTGNAVRGNPSRVRIPPSPPRSGRSRRGGCSGDGATGRGGRELTPKASLLDFRGRARRGTSGALNLQSAPAGLNPHPRTASSQAAASSDVEDRVPRSDEPRTVSGPEGSSTKRPSSGAAERPGPSRSQRRARGPAGRRWVHGNFQIRATRIGRSAAGPSRFARTATGAL